MSQKKAKAEVVEDPNAELRARKEAQMKAAMEATEAQKKKD